MDSFSLGLIFILLLFAAVSATYNREPPERQEGNYYYRYLHFDVKPSMEEARDKYKLLGWNLLEINCVNGNNCDGGQHLFELKYKKTKKRRTEAEMLLAD